MPLFLNGFLAGIFITMALFSCHFDSTEKTTNQAEEALDYAEKEMQK